MSSMTTEQMDALGLSAEERDNVVDHPTDANTFFILKVGLKIVTVKHAGNVGPTISDTGDLYAKPLMARDATTEEETAIGALATSFGMSKVTLGTRWANVLAKLLNF